MAVNVAIVPEGWTLMTTFESMGMKNSVTDVIGNGQTWMAFKLLFYRRGKNLQNEGDKLKYIEKVIEAIGQLENAIERDLYIRQIAEEFSLSLDALNSRKRT